MEKYIFPIGTIRGWFTNIEIRKAIEAGAKVIRTFDGIYYSETFKPFRECVRFLYKERLRHRKSRKDLYYMVKILMNSGLFGKFAQKIDEKTIMHHAESLFCLDDGRPYIFKDGRQIMLKDFTHRGEFVFERIKQPGRIPIFITPILSTYTTALSRIRLWDDMCAYPDDMIYCDTDSIVSRKRHFESSSSLGELKLESKIEQGIFIKPKFYYYNDGESDHFKSKGVGEFIRDKTGFDRIIRDRHVKTERFAKIKESAVRDIPFSSIITVVKNLDLEDDKRAWEKPMSIIDSQKSSPLLLDMQ